MRMNAYYYGFDDTGDDAIDKILSAVACAGKAYHNTEDWLYELDPYDGHTGETVVEWIQNAANEAAEQSRKTEQELGEMKDILNRSIKRLEYGRMVYRIRNLEDCDRLAQILKEPESERGEG